MNTYFQKLDPQKLFGLLPVISAGMLILISLICLYPGLQMKSSLNDALVSQTAPQDAQEISVQAMSANQAERAKILAADIQKSSRIFYSVLVVCLILIILSFFVVKAVNKNILDHFMMPVKQMSQNLDAMSKGNLSTRMEVTSKNLVGEMAQHFNAAMERLHEILAKFSKSCVVLSMTSRNLDENSKKMEDSVNGIIEQVNPVASASEEMAATTSEIAQNCTAAAQSSEKANTAAVSGEAIVKQTIEAIEHINTFVKDAASIIEKLKTRSADISDAVGVIDNIALQTNILALNATIEAARAGEAGKGFAIVADEIKKLATQTTQATQNIGETVEAINTETAHAVGSMKEGFAVVEKGVAEATKSGEALKNILEQINMVTSQISQIADASEGQSAATDEIAQNVQEISNIIKDTKNNVHENADSAERMADLSTDLKKLVGRFRFARPEDAESMINRAYDYFVTHGREKALKAFNDPGGDFIDGELFIFAMDYTGTFLAYGGNPALVGQNHIDAVDPNGKPLGKAMIEIAKKGSGWYEYAYKNPQTEELADKISFIKGTNEDFFLCCGIFK